MHRPFRVFVCLLLGVLTPRMVFGQDAVPGDDLPKRQPEHALASLEVAEGLEVTLFAAEPMLINPTNIDVDARGRVWVCEAYNYRPEKNPGNPTRAEGDRILILEDTTGNGRADTSKVFYQGNDINAALGITVLGSQVVVAVSPYVFVFTDADGDDRPDQRDTLFTGIEGVQDDHGVHTVEFGPDGRLYFNMGNAGNRVHNAQGELIVDAAGNPVVDEGMPYWDAMAFRVNPDGSRFEVLGHNFRNPYEVAVDSYGTVWQSDNDDDGNRGTRINYVMEYGNYGYRDERTGAGWRTPRTGMHPEIPKRHWHQNDPGVVPNLLQTGAGSPTGILVYEGRLLPEMFHNALIHADAGPNVVRAYLIENDGAGYAADVLNILKGVQDEWFRPSDVAVAPDGSLIIADWYDPGVGGYQMDDLQRGRIYRVAPPNTPYRVPPVDLSTPDDAVQALTSPNLATRYLAWQKLHDWGAQAEQALQQLWQSDRSRYRARALWLLGRIEGRGPQYVEAAIHDDDPAIRVTGIRLARMLELDLLPLVREQMTHPSAHVRRELVIALRHHPAPEAADLWAELALQHDGHDRWYLEALGIGADRQWDRFFAAWKARVGSDWNTPAGRDIVWRSRSSEAIPLLAEIITDAATDQAERLRYVRALDFHADTTAKRDVLIGLLNGDHPDQPQITALALKHLDGLRADEVPALQEALQRTLPTIRGTQTFVDLVRKFEVRDQVDALVEMALENPEATAGVEAARLALELGGADPFRAVLEGSDRKRAQQALTVLGYAGTSWEESDAYAVILSIIGDAERPLSLRQAAVRAMGQTLEGEHNLLNFIEDGRLPPELEETAAEVLFASYRRQFRDRAARYLEPPEVKAAGGEPLSPVGQLITRTGDPARGRAVFEHTCMSCHRVGGEGVDFGPDLSDIGNKLGKEALYRAILRPSAGITFGYEGYEVTLTDGSKLVGYIVSEMDEAIALRRPGGITSRLDRDKIEAMQELDTSLMTPNLQQTMTERELVDLIEYLRHLQVTTPTAQE